MGYLLFTGNDFYPMGGANDLIGRFETINEAIEHHDKKEFSGRWAHILNLDTLSVVKVFIRGEWFDPE